MLDARRNFGTGLAGLRTFRQTEELTKGLKQHELQLEK
jgi:hypothetical protein